MSAHEAHAHHIAPAKTLWSVGIGLVILTAVTTILGLIPLAIGINIDFIKFFTSYDADFYMGGDNVIFWGPMSWTIIFGLTFATFLTLVIVPVMYLIMARINRALKIA